MPKKSPEGVVEVGEILGSIDVDVARCGEKLVLSHLQRTTANEAVWWVNESGESKWPFDLVLGVSSAEQWKLLEENDCIDELVKQSKVKLIEVKSSTKRDKSLFNLSLDELSMQFAMVPHIGCIL